MVLVHNYNVNKSVIPELIEEHNNTLVLAFMYSVISLRVLHGISSLV